MKTVVVPAQITTVEDKIAGNLTLIQMLLLASAVFIDFAIYVLFPHPLRLSGIKIVLMIIVSTIQSFSALRIQEKIVLFWFITIYRFSIRPMHYVFDKNSDYLRKFKLTLTEPKPKDLNDKLTAEIKSFKSTISVKDRIRLEHLGEDPMANMTFITDKKGKLHVSYTEI